MSDNKTRANDQTADKPMVFNIPRNAKYEFDGEEYPLVEYLEKKYGPRGSGVWSMNHSTSPSTIKFFKSTYGVEWRLTYG